MHTFEQLHEDILHQKRRQRHARWCDAQLCIEVQDHIMHTFEQLQAEILHQKRRQRDDRSRDVQICIEVQDQIMQTFEDKSIRRRQRRPSEQLD